MQILIFHDNIIPEYQLLIFLVYEISYHPSL